MRSIKSNFKDSQASFLDSDFLDHAYQDKAFLQVQIKPFPNLTPLHIDQLLILLAGSKVLEIGTGSGYQTAVLCELGAEVYSIERQNELFKTVKFLPKLDIDQSYLW